MDCTASKYTYCGASHFYTLLGWQDDFGVPLDCSDGESIHAGWWDMARNGVAHRSYKRQGIDKIPSVHLGPAASQMEKRGIRTDKGEVHRQIAADNKLLKEIKARITRLYRWSKAEAEMCIRDSPYSRFL